jgi:hypothetical protein
VIIKSNPRLTTLPRNVAEWLQFIKELSAAAAPDEAESAICIQVFGKRG